MDVGYMQKTKFKNRNYRQCSYTSKTAKILLLVRFVMYCFITTVPA